MMRTRVSKVVEIFSTIAEEFDLIHANPYSQIMPCHDGGFQLEFVSTYKPGYKSHDLL